MSLTLSTGLANYIASGGGWGEALKNGILDVYSGSKPTTANDASAGSLLARFSTNAGAATAETRAACKFVIAGGSGSVDTINVGGYALLSSAVSYNGTLAQTLADVISNINSNSKNNGFYAITGGGTVGSVTYGAANAGEFYIIAPKNSGASYNSVTTTTTSTTLTIALNTDASPSTSESGAFAAVSGDSASGFTAGVNATTCLYMTYPAVGGLISKGGTWSANTITYVPNTGTAAWFRYRCTPNYDDGTGTILSTGTAASLIMRMDGTVGTSGSDLIISSTSIVAAASQTINQFDLTIA